MIKPSVRWCALIALSLPALSVSVLQADDSTAAAQVSAGAVLQQFGSPDGIRQNASLPLTSYSSQLSTIDGSNSASVQISNPSSNAFLSVTIQPSATGDLMPVHVSQDLNFDGLFDYNYQVPFPASGICANGIISCGAGTWDNCTAYQWGVDNATRAILQNVSMNQLAGCYCVNQSCGGYTNTQAMLKDIGGAVIAQVQAQKGGYIISRVGLNANSISYYGQDSSGSPTGNVPQLGYYGDPGAMSADTNNEIITQAADPDSYYSMMTGSFTQKGTNSGLETCTISRNVVVHQVALDDVILPMSGTGTMETCGADCIRIIIGREGNNYWSGQCTIFEDEYTLFVARPDLIQKATLVRAIWDDYLQVWIGGSKVYNGPNDNFPPETGGTCELSTSWDVGLNKDVTGFFRQEGELDTKIRVSVTGGNTEYIYEDHTLPADVQGETIHIEIVKIPYITEKGEGYAYIEVRVNDLCEIFDELVTNNCLALEADSDCQLQEEVIDGVQTFYGFNPTGSVPLPSNRIISGGATCSMNITRDWWQKNRTYRCTHNNTFDFSDAGRRVDTITGSLDNNSLGQSTFDYTDTQLDQTTGSWQTDDQNIVIPDNQLPTDCEFVCKTRKIIQDTQASLAGVSTDYQSSNQGFDILYHVCGADNTCPIGVDEEIVKECQCLDEFAEAASIMMALDEAGRDMECSDGSVTSLGDCMGDIKIFNGRRNECLQNGWSTSFFDCCNDSVGSFLFLEEHCPKKSVETVQAKQAGMAHFIGTYCKKDIEFIGCVQEADVYCIFNSKLGRIIHEQGRSQLQKFAPSGNWGSTRRPNCEGFTPEEFQMLDFSEIDLSEMFGDIEPLPATKMQNDVQGAINDFQNKVQ